MKSKRTFKEKFEKFIIKFFFWLWVLCIVFPLTIRYDCLYKIIWVPFFAYIGN